MIKNLFFYIITLVTITLFVPQAFAKQEYPNLTGDVFFESRIGMVNSEENPNTYSNSLLFNVEPKLSLNINDEWSVKTKWQITPFKKRTSPNYEIGNVFPSTNYSDDASDYGMIVEELKGDYRTDDLNFFFGKYNPTYGEAWKKEKRIGVFATDFAEDYELREKLGGGIGALLDDGGMVALNLFLNDTTGLSNSAISRRGRNKSGNNIAGNNNNLSSYSVTFSGNNLFSVENLKYNFGYRDLDVENQPGYDNEKGYLAGLEYDIPLNYKTNLIPFIELAKFDNFYGVSGQDILYTTASLTVKYSNWQTGISASIRDIDRSGTSGDFTDNQVQYFVGYKFQSGIAVDVAHLNVKESNNKANILGIALSYLYSF